MIRFQQVSLARGVKPLLENTDVTLNPGEKVGLVGSNGMGKSSLFALLRGELQVDQGSVDFPAKWQVAHVAQETPPLERSAIDYAIDGDVKLRQLESELAELEDQPETHENGEKMGEIYGALADADAYTVRSRAEQLLIGLGFSMAQLNQSVASFSGGWRMRLNLAQALMCPSDLLLLDEPTNHLDLDAIIWLEDWLKKYAGTLIIISHDRDFLDGVANVIIHIDDRKLNRYSGNYSAFERQRVAKIILAQSALEKQNRQRAHLESFINRFKAKASKAKQAQSRMKALAKMEELAPLRAAAEFSFEFREPLKSPDTLLIMDEVEAGYLINDEQGNQQKKIIVSDINFSLHTGQRIGLLGVNGAGKSTLIKTLAGSMPPISGDVQMSRGTVIGYFAQHQVEMLRHDQSALWHLAQIAPRIREQELRSFIGGFNFHGDMATAPIAPFSGGEKARLALALIVWQRPNLLLLDEPTNHLDLETREALTDALAQFDGTLIVVSHDRHLLRATTDQFMLVADGALTAFDGDLDDYRNWLFKTKLSNKLNSAETKPAKVAAVVAQPQKISTESKKTVMARLKKLEEQIAQVTKNKAIIDERLAGTDLYEPAQKEKLKSALAEQTICVKKLIELEIEWLAQQEILEAME